MPSPTVFISYSHKDESWKDRLVTHLQPLRGSGQITTWDDRMIAPGGEWETQLERALEDARIAVLLISPDFMASPFIQKLEIPRLLERQEKGELRLIPVIVRTCDWQALPWLKPLQIFQDGRPLSKLRGSQRDVALSRLTLKIRDAIQQPAEAASGPKVSLEHFPSTHAPLFGRERELKLLDDAWENPRVRLVTVLGMGGIGKTALVSHWLALLAADDYRGAQRVFGWSFYSHPSVNDFFKAALTWFQGRESSEDKAEQLSNHLHQQRTLLVLDGLEVLQEPSGPDVGRLRDHAFSGFLHELASFPSGLVVLTSRIEIPELRGLGEVLRLEGLSPEAGASLLRSLGVRGSDAELANASRELEGHSLALQVLGSVLRDSFDGDIEKSSEAAPSLGQSEPVLRLISSLTESLGEGPELALLRILSLFPAEASSQELNALLAEPPISGLTEALQGRDASEPARRLHEMGLASSGEDPGSPRAHPLLRAFLGRQFREKNPEAARQAYERLFWHLQSTVRGIPSTFEEMSPLFSAIYFGCAAGLTKEALALYQEKISRGEERYITRNLGLYALDLQALFHLFRASQEKHIAGLEKRDILFLYQAISADLLALGLPLKAAEFLKVVVDESSQERDWETATQAASLLVEAHLALGDLVQARAIAQQNLELAIQSAFPALQKAVALLTCVQFQRGESPLQGIDPALESLAPSQALLVLDLLLDQRGPAPVLAAVRTALQKAERKGALSDIALTSIALGRILTPGEALSPLDNTVRLLRQMGAPYWLPSALLARAAVHSALARFADAQRDLDEALAITTQIGLRLQETDAHIALVRLHLATGDLAKARSSFERARTLVEETGYHRRDVELQELESRFAQEATDTSADPLALAFRLVLAGQARPDLLINLNPGRLRRKARSLAGEEPGDPLAQAQQILKEQQPDVEPNPLWLAWMTVTQGPALQSLKKRS